MEAGLRLPLRSVSACCTAVWRAVDTGVLQRYCVASVCVCVRVFRGCGPQYRAAATVDDAVMQTVGPDDTVSSVRSHVQQALQVCLRIQLVPAASAVLE